jgi:hypothetical protein
VESRLNKTFARKDGGYSPYYDYRGKILIRNIHSLLLKNVKVVNFLVYVEKLIVIMFDGVKDIKLAYNPFRRKDDYSSN